MPAPLVVVGLAVAVIAKAVGSVWFSSRATSPLSAPWRKEFLKHFAEEITILEKNGLSSPEWIETLRADHALLKAHVAEGWGTKELFDAASRVSYYRSWKHTTTGLSGIGGLFGSYFDHATAPLEGMVKDFFRQPPRDSAP